MKEKFILKKFENFDQKIETLAWARAGQLDSQR
jgi:hypothetical protein